MAPKKNIWHTTNENKIIQLLGAKKRGLGADGVDPQGVPFEIRESKKPRNLDYRRMYMNIS